MYQFLVRLSLASNVLTYSTSPQCRRCSRGAGNTPSLCLLGIYCSQPIHHHDIHCAHTINPYPVGPTIVANRLNSIGKCYAEYSSSNPATTPTPAFANSDPTDIVKPLQTGPNTLPCLRPDSPVNCPESSIWAIRRNAGPTGRHRSHGSTILFAWYTATTSHYHPGYTAKGGAVPRIMDVLLCGLRSHPHTRRLNLQDAGVHTPHYSRGPEARRYRMG